ncbi:MAG: CarD family transcriptional regulator [Chloroflexota bacterium]|nr:CarD family transcriptional regulator [Chloroflexota bacterium]
MTLYIAGDRVFHPFFGAGTIVSVESKRIGGGRRCYYVIDMIMDAMQIMVPVDRVGTIGLRKVGEGKRLQEMLHALDSLPKVKEAKGTARRTRQEDMRERLKSGSFIQIRDTVRELHVMQSERPLGMMDRELLEQGKRFLAGELALALGLKPEEALREVEGSLSAIMEQQEQHTEG